MELHHRNDRTSETIHSEEQQWETESLWLCNVHVNKTLSMLMKMSADKKLHIFLGIHKCAIGGRTYKVFYEILNF